MRRFRPVVLTILAFVAGGFATVGWQDWQTHRAPAAHAATPDGKVSFAPPSASLAGAPASPADPGQPDLLSDADWPRDAPTPEQVIYAQPDLLNRETARLRSRTPGEVNLYAVVFAGDGSQNVFRNEAEYFDKLLSQRLGASGHVLVLENNPASLSTRPLASWSNLEDALDAVASKMDPKQDILLVYLTTHGSEDHTL